MIFPHWLEAGAEPGPHCFPAGELPDGMGRCMGPCRRSEHGDRQSKSRGLGVLTPGGMIHAGMFKQTGGTLTCLPLGGGGITEKWRLRGCRALGSLPARLLQPSTKGHQPNTMET